MIGEFWMFVFNTLAHWQSLLTGGIIALFILFVEHYKRKSISWRALLLIMGISLFISSFLAWRDEHQNSEILKVENAKLVGDRNVLQAKVEEKQNEIEQIRRQELRIAQEELQLKYAVSVDLIYQDKQLKIFNRGKTNLFLWGTKFDNSSEVIEKQPRLLSPADGNAFGLGQSYYYLLGERLEKALIGKFGQNGEGLVPLELFIKNQNGQKHTVKCQLLVKVINGAIQIHPQNVGIVLGW